MSLGAGTMAWFRLLIDQKTAWNRKEHTYATWNVWRKPQPWNKEQETARQCWRESTEKHLAGPSWPYIHEQLEFLRRQRVEVFVLGVWIITPALYKGPALFTNRSRHTQASRVHMWFYHPQAATFQITQCQPPSFLCPWQPGLAAPSPDQPLCWDDWS